jgi:hypothetical protein
MAREASSQLIKISVTRIGEYVRHGSCRRRFALSLDEKKVAEEVPFISRLAESMDPVLQEMGRRRENEWEEMLEAQGLRKLLSDENTWEAFTLIAADLSKEEKIFAREVKIDGSIGAFWLDGKMDFALIIWRDGKPKLRLVECKASRKDQTYHRLQISAYRILIEKLLRTYPLVIGGITLTIDDVECLVVRIDADSNENQDMLSLPEIDPSELVVMAEDIEELLSAEGALAQTSVTPISEIEYQLDAKCGGCKFGLHCFPESARLRKLELLGMDAACARELRAEGIETIDQLAALDPEGEASERLRRLTSVGTDPGTLVRRAKVRLPLLPGGDKKSYQVEPLSGSGEQSALPVHGEGEERLIRIFLVVDYDYAENRLAALTAHVTRSDSQLHTGFRKKSDGSYESDPDIRERKVREDEETGEKHESMKPMREVEATAEIVKIISEPWSGNADKDGALEHDLLSGFFLDLVATIQRVAASEEAPLHFYVWEKAEMSKLIEACARLDSALLRPLRDLFGSRDGLEEMIYSSLQDEVQRRYALAISGRSLAATLSLSWFRKSFHWHRKVGGQILNFEEIFKQDIFNFKERLALTAEGGWATRPRERAETVSFEVRGRYSDSLTAPYLRAYWGTLEEPHIDRSILFAANPETEEEKERQALKRTIKNYNDAARPKGYLPGYLKARAQGLRWIEEKVFIKNSQIVKKPFRLKDLPSFKLNVTNASQASVDFLRLDQHVKVSDWMSARLSPPQGRVLKGETLPLKNIRLVEKSRLIATLAPERYLLNLSEMASAAMIGEGSFSRITPAHEDPRKGQTFNQLLYGGRTARVDSINWDTGEVFLDVFISKNATRYILPSRGFGKKVGEDEEGNAEWENFTPGEVIFDFATLDDSPSDFVAGRVEKRLIDKADHPAIHWLDLSNPTLTASAPLDPERMKKIEQVIGSSFGGHSLAPDQQEAVRDGLSTRAQLLQGPPGTGKTQTSAIAVMTRILARREPGEIVLVGAHTHTAVDTLLERMLGLREEFSQAASEAGLTMPNIKVGRAVTVMPTETKEGITYIAADRAVTPLKELCEGGVAVIGGTTGSLLKMAGELEKSKSFEGFRVKTLIIDEASMMIYPHFLSLATLLEEEGSEVMLAGDNRQLSPIVAHDWEEEDRPPAVLYMPYASAYDALAELGDAINDSTRVCRSALNYTFRLPERVRQLISRVYSKDSIALAGREATEETMRDIHEDVWPAVWQGNEGVYLILHDEASSQRSNEVEADIIAHLLGAATGLPASSVAVVTPHRAQRSLLKERLAPWMVPGGSLDMVDTVERLQGGERPTVIVSACASDPNAIAARADFLLNLNRANVAFSRPKERLIVVCSRSLLEHIPGDLAIYESALLWKSLRGVCSHPLGEREVSGHRVKVFSA